VKYIENLGAKMRINEVAKLTGVSARTLQYYDEIGLLIPEKLNNGYRDYSDENLDKLQKILFYRFLKFKLNDIKELLDEDIDSLKILEQQRELILKEKENFEIILHNIEKTIKTYKGEQKMTIEEKFNGFKKEDLNKYEDQAIEKYGKGTIEESKKRQSGKEDIVAEKFNSVFRSMAEYRKNNIDIEEKEVQSKVEELYNYMNKYAFDCSVEVFSYIGKGYSQNPEFKKNIDKFGEGVAEYTSRAIDEYCKKGLNKMIMVAVILIGTGTLAGIIANSNIKDIFTSLLSSTGAPAFLSAPLSGILMSAATASTTSGTAVASKVFGPSIVSLGVKPLSAAAMIHSGATVLDHLPHGSFFHATAGAVNMEIKDRLLIIPFESLIGLTLTIVSTILFGIFGL